ncbi:GNAT family N-acetyltransferase [Priestia endophytica]|uniref:GNAT family N-acetyltransferase n=1 Tax=Priestia endophytica TaxID=135735 RepID=UPI00124D8708|nr:GNAT family N-acetyltransferase [Priestia endophytica]KAB2488374.1 GNAT family N-acetyltransferase [Priestia endophytica]
MRNLISTYVIRLPRYAKSIAENTKIGEQQALETAEQKLKSLLPEGNNTPGHLLFNVIQDNTFIGYIWIKISDETKQAFLYEIYIEEQFRSKGNGTLAIQLVEELLIEQGIKSFNLHVFGHHTGAFKLYERIGFNIVGINMQKKLSST